MANSALNKLKSKVKTKTLVGKQKNLDVNKNGKLDKEDFKILRGNKMAKGGETKEFIDWDKIIGKKVNGWEAADNNGISILWENDNSEYSFYATPGWENEKKLPIQIVGDGGDFGIAMFSKNEDASYQLNDYLMEVKEIIRIINSKKTLSVSDFKNDFSKVINNGDSFAHGGKTQGYDDKEDERLGMKRGKISSKDLKTAKARRDDARFEERMADGGAIPNNYKGKKAQQVWNEWTIEQKRHFLEDHEDQLRKTGGQNVTLFSLSKKSYDDLPLFVGDALIEHITTGQYADGGQTYDKTLFQKELADFKQHINDGYGWISPEYVRETWENMNFKTDIDNVNSPVTQDLYKDLIESKLLYHEDSEDEEDKGERVKTFKELYGWNYGENVEYAKGGETKEDKSFIIVAKDITIKADNVEDFIKKANANDYTLMQVYNQNDEEVKSKNPIFNFSWMIGLPRFKELVGPMKDGPNQFRYEDEWVNERMSVEKGGYMADGGVIAQENNEMLQSNMKEIRHHSDELKNIVTDSTEVEPWVIAKTERASTDLSDVTHYLDGEKDRSLKMPFEKGGYLAKGGMVSLSKYYKTLAKKDDLIGSRVYDKNNDEFVYIKNVDSGIFAGKNKNDDLGHNYTMSDLMIEEMADGGMMTESEEVSFKASEVKNNFNLKLNECKDELQLLGQYYDVRSDSFQAIRQSYINLNNAGLNASFTYDKDLKRKEEMQKNGYMEEGGKIANQYENLTPKEIWSMWSETQRAHFLRDHKHEFPEIQDSIFVLRKKDFGKLPARIQIAIEYHVEDGQYAMGGKLNRETYERMSELTSITAKKELTTAAKSIRHELEEEGFENNEVDSYLCHIVTNSYKDGGMMAKGGMTAKDRKIADHIVKTYNMDEPGMAPVYANQLRREEARLNKTYGSDWQKTMSPADKANRFLEAVRVADNDIKLKDITVEASPRGNWVVLEHGKVIMTVNQDMLDEETIRTYNLEHHNK